ncbi:basic form of pathogenesis-related protein 1-like [Hevea brasiliensis]|uniref:basic form of pathogenesis-related protein 1-like n=1 Tax=Hevea brasiliensis TaxID=3981 RepID=UPI0025D07C2A|nr:basic form of pathogenesis-related protein 1-like [Hevea brasiliensis]
MLCMTSLAFFSLIICSLSLTSNILPSLAQNTPQDYLNAHNEARVAANAGYITGNNTLAIYALNYSLQRIGDCNLVYSNGRNGKNISSSTSDITSEEAVKMWIDEKSFYDYNSNSCATGRQCRNYIQVVWRNTAQVGCAKVRCTMGGTLVTCSYDPPSNFAGERPY